MCGIAGIYYYDKNQFVDSLGVQPMLEAFRYRGPDHMGFYETNALCMGNVRLAIQGLDESGNQPVYNEDSSLVTVYNGEIYNYSDLREYLEQMGHRFDTTTDTEILVHAYETWGDLFPRKLNGMFAGALYVKDKHTLHLFRDRMAQKPLYYAEILGGIAFASEWHALLTCIKQKQLNPEALRAFYSMGYVPEPNMLVDGIQCVEPGSSLVLSANGTRVCSWLEWSENKGDTITTIDSWLEEADEIFERVMHRHLLSDTPLTMFLSGGIDSGLIGLYLAKCGKIHKAYTASFVDYPDYDEYPYVQKLADHIGMDLERVELSLDTLADNMESFLQSSSFPQGDTSSLASYALAKVCSAQYRVVLGGDGGDELFCGYPTCLYPQLRDNWGWIPRTAFSWAHACARRFSNESIYFPLAFKLQFMKQAWSLPDHQAQYEMKNYLPTPLARSILSDDLLALSSDKAGGSVIEEAHRNCPVDGSAHRMSWADMNTFLRSCTIPKTERNSMLHSLECRLPFLDNEMLALSLRTPQSLMLRGKQLKYCLRQLHLKKTDMKKMNNPRKQGFTPPIKALLKHRLKDWYDYAINIDSPWLSKNADKKIKQWEDRGYDLHRLKWSLAVMNDWLNRHDLL